MASQRLSPKVNLAGQEVWHEAVDADCQAPEGPAGQAVPRERWHNHPNLRSRSPAGRRRRTASSARPTRCWATAGPRSPRCCWGGEPPAGAGQGHPLGLCGDVQGSVLFPLAVFTLPRRRGLQILASGGRDLAQDWSGVGGPAPVHGAGSHLGPLGFVPWPWLHAC